MPIRLPKSALFEGARRVGDAAADYAGTALDGFPIQRMEAIDGSLVDATEVTPRNYLENLLDDPDHADDVIRRIDERNPADDINAAVFHDGDFVESVDRPVTILARPEGGTFNDGTLGTYSEDVIRLDSDRIPDFEGPDEFSGHMLGDVNTLEHELNHGLLQGAEPVEDMGVRREIGSLGEVNGQAIGRMIDEGNPDEAAKYIRKQTALRRPDALSSADGIPQMEHLASNQPEFANFLFHLKRMSELVHDEDYGVNRAASNRLGKKLMREPVNFDPVEGRYIDPQISREGFRQGDIAHGYERMKEMLQALYSSSTPDGKAMIRRYMHQLGMVGLAASLAETEENPLGRLIE